MISILTRIVNKLRYFFLYKNSLKSVGNKPSIFKGVRLEGNNINLKEHVSIQKDTWLYSHNNGIIEFGNGCVIGYRNHITSSSSVRFGNEVLTANNVYVSDNVHEFKNINIPIMNQAITTKNEVNIGDGAWLGENVCIVGASVGKNSVIGANSVVTKDIPDYCVAVGSPAKVIKKYNLELNKWENL